MTRHRVALSALLAQPHPLPPVLREDILDRRPEGRADPRERIDHEPDQRAIAQACDLPRVDAVEQRARFAGIEHRRLPGRDNVAGPRTDAAGLTGTTWPVTSQSNKWRTPASRCLTLGAASSRVPASIHVATCTGCTAPIDGAPALAHQGKEFFCSSSIGPSRVRVADVSREEFDEAHPGALADGDHEHRQTGRGDWNELVHGRALAAARASTIRSR
jgi:hypothetical protein